MGRRSFGGINVPRPWVGIPAPSRHLGVPGGAALVSVRVDDAGTRVPERAGDGEQGPVWGSGRCTSRSPKKSASPRPCEHPSLISRGSRAALAVPASSKTSKKISNLNKQIPKTTSVQAFLGGKQGIIVFIFILYLRIVHLGENQIPAGKPAPGARASRQRRLPGSPWEK